MSQLQLTFIREGNLFARSAREGRQASLTWKSLLIWTSRKNFLMILSTSLEKVTMKPERMRTPLRLERETPSGDFSFLLLVLVLRDVDLHYCELLKALN